MPAPIVLISGALAVAYFAREKRGQLPPVPQLAPGPDGAWTPPAPLPIADGHTASGPTIPANFACAIGLREADGQTYSAGGWHGGQINAAAVEVMVAHAAFETARFVALHDYNAWNMIEVRKGYPYVIRTDRGGGGDVDPTTPGDQQKFATFDSFQSCGKRYLALVRAHYPQALLGAMKGDVGAYVAGMKAGVGGRAWFTAAAPKMVAGISGVRQAVE